MGQIDGDRWCVVRLLNQRIFDREWYYDIDGDRLSVAIIVPSWWQLIVDIDDESQLFGISINKFRYDDEVSVCEIWQIVDRWDVRWRSWISGFLEIDTMVSVLREDLIRQSMIQISDWCYELLVDHWWRWTDISFEDILKMIVSLDGAWADLSWVVLDSCCFSTPWLTTSNVAALQPSWSVWTLFIVNEQHISDTD